MKITYNSSDQGQLGDILLINDRIWIVYSCEYLEHDNCTLLSLTDSNNKLSTVISNDNMIKSIFRNTTIEQVLHDHPELFI